MGRSLSAFNGLPDGGLTPKQEALALALAGGATLRDAARKARCGETTAKRWLADEPALVRRVGELRAEMTSRALGRLADATASAADTLGFLCRKAKSENTRLMAARAVLELNNRLGETAELAARLAALEQKQPTTPNRSAA